MDGCGSLTEHLLPMSNLLKQKGAARMSPYISQISSIGVGSGKSSTHPQSKFTATRYVLPCLIWLAHLLEWSTQEYMSNLGQGLVVMTWGRNSLQSIVEPSTNTLRRVVAHANSKGHAPRKLLLSGSHFRKPSTRPSAYGSSGSLDQRAGYS